MIFDVIASYIFIISAIVFPFFNIYYLMKGYRGTLLFLYPFLFIFNVLPMVMHMVFGQADYMYFGVVEEAMSDTTSVSIYKLVIVVVSLALWISFHNKKGKIRNMDRIKLKNSESAYYNKMADYMFLLELFPIIWILFQEKYRGNFLTYGARYLYSNVEEIPAYILGWVSTAFVFYCLNADSKKYFKNFMALFLVLVAMYLRGSRAIVVTVIAMTIYALILSNKMNIRRVMIVLGIMIPVILVMLYKYHKIFRLASEGFYTYYSIDLSRDYTVVYSIYAQLKGIKILEYPGQSILFCLLCWLPRSMAKWKPYPFSAYMTSSLLGYGIRHAGFLSMRTTTNILSELVVNFGIVIGTILTIVCLNIVIYLSDHARTLNKKMLFIYIGFEMLTLDFANWIISIGTMCIYIVVIQRIPKIKFVLGRKGY